MKSDDFKPTSETPIGEASNTAASPPKEVMKPLFWGFAAILIFLVSFVCWASIAPISTSILASGHLNASQPSFDLQHPFGGDVKVVQVRDLDHVQAGQILLRMNVDNEKDQKEHLEGSLALLRDEKAAIEWALRVQNAARASDNAQKSDWPTLHPTVSKPLPPPPQSQQSQRIGNMLAALALREQTTSQISEGDEKPSDGSRRQPLDPNPATSLNAEPI